MSPTAPPTPAHPPLVEAAGKYLRHAAMIERASRIARLAGWIAGFEAFRTIACSREAVQAGAWYVDAWAVDEVLAGRLDPFTLALVTLDDQQADASADRAERSLRGVVDDITLDLAVSALRLAPSRATRMPEAQILSEALNLESIGPVWLTAQISRCIAERRPLKAIPELWRRQQEYQYWPRRIEETLRFEPTRGLANQQLAGLSAAIESLDAQLTANPSSDSGVPR